MWFQFKIEHKWTDKMLHYRK